MQIGEKIYSRVLIFFFYYYVTMIVVPCRVLRPIHFSRCVFTRLYYNERCGAYTYTYYVLSAIRVCVCVCVSLWGLFGVVILHNVM